jgi:acyl-CoA reductase-like NAD-dependent aldehyde dehydrogenase
MKIIAHVQGGGTEQVDQAVRAAHAGFLQWRLRAPRERGRLLLDAARLLRAHADEIAALESAENGKPVSVARNYDVEMCIASFEYFGALIGNLPREFHDLGALVSQGYLEPYGVVGGVIPFNWPPIHFGAKVAPALAVGNSIVLKPGEQAPLTIMRLAELVQSVLPDDVIHVVPGKGPTGAALVSHPLVRKISFTGAPGTGRKVLHAAAEKLTPALVELGGKNPFVVFADADIDVAVQDAVEAAFFNNGEACTAASRLLLHASIHDEFVEKLAAAIRRLKVGDGADATTHVGPMVTREHQQRVLSCLDMAHEEGARVAAQASLPTDPRLQAGCFVAPTLLVDVTPQMRIAKEEVFGPVLCAMRFQSYEEAIQIANDTEFALVAGIYSADVLLAQRAGRDIEAGIVFINNYNRAVLGTPFGGTKSSGYGREHCIDTLKEFGYAKTMRIPTGRGEIGRWAAAAEVTSPVNDL